jgi:hypothetical protein
MMGVDDMDEKEEKLLYVECRKRMPAHFKEIRAQGAEGVKQFLLRQEEKVGAINTHTRLSFSFPLPPPPPKGEGS